MRISKETLFETEHKAIKYALDMHLEAEQKLAFIEGIYQMTTDLVTEEAKVEMMPACELPKRVTKYDS